MGRHLRASRVSVTNCSWEKQSTPALRELQARAEKVRVEGGMSVLPATGERLTRLGDGAWEGGKDWPAAVATGLEVGDKLVDVIS